MMSFQEEKKTSSKVESLKDTLSKQGAFGDTYPTLDEENWAGDEKAVKSKVSFQSVEGLNISGSVVKSMKEEFKTIAANSSREIQQSLQGVMVKSSLEKKESSDLKENEQKMSKNGSERSPKASLQKVSETGLVKTDSQKTTQSLELENQL